jgi:hypothetical protein
MKIASVIPRLIISMGLISVVFVDSQLCLAAIVNFIPDVVAPVDGNFDSGSNWSDGNVPMADFDRHFVQDSLTASVTGGNAAVHFLTIGDTSVGRLNMSGGTLDVLATDQFEIGEGVGGEGHVTLTGSSILRAAGAVVGTRSKGFLTVGPNATLELAEAPFSRDLRVGSYGPAFIPGGPPEPDLNGDGLVIIQGTLDAASLILSQSGAKGALQVAGGTVNLEGSLWMDLCEGCGTDPVTLALRSAKVSVLGSGGVFNVGIGGIRAASPTATFSFTADSGGVTTIAAENSTADIESARLELDLDAYPFTPTSKLTLINALDFPGSLIGEFATVTFHGNTTAEVHYDLVNGDVFLDNFQTLVNGDFDNDGDYDCADVNSLVSVIATNSNQAAFDLTGDRLVNGSDLQAWLVQGGANHPMQTGGRPFRAGDANLDGVVDGSDFGIWNSNKFTLIAAWCSGDFNANGAVDGSDFGVWNSNKFTSSADAIQVPEPFLAGWLACGLALIVRYRK